MNRGGSWNNPADHVRVGYRNGDIPGNRNNDQGFRLVRVLSPQPAAQSGLEQALPQRPAVTLA